jgi:ubiquinone/menaquinone biosynthesis C-methylase UbiE
MAHEWYSSYDYLVARVCPDYEAGLDSVVNAIPRQTRNIIEIGCGTGNLTLRLAKRFPEASIFGIDNDGTLLDLARQKTKEYSNVNLTEGTFPDINIGTADAIVSSLLFHLMLPEERIETLRKIYLASNQVVVFDRMKGETTSQENMFREYFIRNLLGQNLPQGDVREIVNESSRNNPMRLSEHMQICESNGFKFQILHQNPNHGFVAYTGVQR